MKSFLVGFLLFVAFYTTLTQAARWLGISPTDYPVCLFYPVLCFFLGLLATPGKYTDQATTGQYLTMIAWAFIPGLQFAAFYYAGKTITEKR